MTRPLPLAPDRLAGPSLRRFALLWLVAALLFQGFVTQTHGHLGVDGKQPAAQTTRMATATVDNQKNKPAAPACPLCEEKALFGAYLLGGTVTIAAPAEMAYDYAATSLSSLAFRPSPHAWRSRAPPIFTA